MEDFLDAISRRESEHLQYLNEFYFGDGKPGLKQHLRSKEAEIDPRLMSRFPIGVPDSGPHRDEIILRVGKYGPFLEQGSRKASLPADMAPDELTLQRALELLDAAQVDDTPLGHDPVTHKPVYLKTGRFGPYVQLGTADDDEKPKNASLLRDMKPEDVTLDIALKILSLPLTLGHHPDSQEPIEAFNGRYGPYIKCGAETRSLPAGMSPLDVTLEEAIELLKQPKPRGRGRAAAAEPLRVFDQSPVTGQPIKLLNGRYGPYVTDGTTNASLPKNARIDEFSYEQAIQLLAERAAFGPSTKKKARRAPTSKKAKSPNVTARKKAKSATATATKKSATKKRAAVKKGKAS
jgi:DNA topoisomerase-1